MTRNTRNKQLVPVVDEIPFYLDAQIESPGRPPFLAPSATRSIKL